MRKPLGDDLVVSGTHARFGGMVWPFPCEQMSELVWTLTYGEPGQQDKLYAAAIISAFRQMVDDPESKRRVVIRALRKAMKESGGTP